MSKGKETTIYDIASKLNISPATVSRGLNDNPAINKNTRKKIFLAAKELGYRSNTIASSLRSKKTYTIGVIVPRLNSNFMSAALSGMEDVASVAGYNLIITQSQESKDKEKANAHTMFAKRVDGLLVSLSADTESPDHFQPFFDSKIPVVFFDRIFQKSDSTGVIIDNFQAGYQITAHLIGQGYTRIMHIAGNLQRNVYKERFEGYKKALEDNGISFTKNLLLINDLNEQAGMQAAEHILKMKTRPDAVFAANDSCAVFCMLRLKEAGLQLPADMGFAGFNNDPISNVIEPNLTTVNYSGFLMGQTALSNLLQQIANKQADKVMDKIVMRSEIIVRASSLKK